MNVGLSTEHVFVRTPDGAVWTDGSFPRSYWDKYLHIFDAVTVLARVRDVAAVPAEYRRSDGPAVSFVALPPYRGFRGFARHATTIGREAVATAARTDLLALRVPGTIGNLAATVLAVRRKPFVLEVVGDPWESLAPGMTGRRAAALARPVVTGALRLQCRLATGVAYVTDRTLQQRYPARRTAPVGAYAAVELSDEAFAGHARAARISGPWRLVFVGSLAVRYKGLAVLLEALRTLREREVDVSLTVVGSGTLEAEYRALATQYAVAAHVEFVGQVPSGEGVRGLLRAGDVFVMPSRTEGLPSALLEAMALGLPCVASRIGGIPELLPERCTVRPGDPGALAAKLAEVLADPVLREEEGARNRQTAMRYREEELQRRREAFFRSVLGRLSDAPVTG